MLKRKSKTPWAVFSIDGFEDNGLIKVNFLWNPAFIEKIHALGFHAETEEDSVMLFYYASQMKPDFMDKEGAVQSDQHPSLTSASNEMRV